MVKQRLAEVCGSLGIVFPNVGDDLGEVVLCSLCVEEPQVHLRSNLRTCSAGTVRPALASAIPSSMAAQGSFVFFFPSRHRLLDVGLFGLAHKHILTLVTPQDNTISYRRAPRF